MAKKIKGDISEQFVDLNFIGKDAETGIYTFVASDERVDRDGDIIRVGGWDLRDYKKNPVILFGHGHSGVDGGLPIGRATRVFKDNSTGEKRLIIQFKFIPEEVYPFAGLIKKMVDGKFLNTGSVRFIPTDFEAMKDEDMPEGYTGYKGRVYKKQGLAEWSLVTLPSNVGSVQLEMKSYEKMYKDTQQTVDEWLKQEQEVKEDDDSVTFEDIVADINDAKSGRVLSKKNRTLVENTVKSIEGLLSGLKELLTATSPEPEQEPDVENDLEVMIREYNEKHLKDVKYVDELLNQNKED